VVSREASRGSFIVASPAAPALTGTQWPGHSPLNDRLGGHERHLAGWGFRDRTQAEISKSEN